MNDFVRVFRLTPALASLLGLLMEKPTVTKSDIEADGRVPANVRVSVCRLRKEMEQIGVEVKSRRYIGYWIEDVDKQKVRDRLEAVGAA